MRSTPRLAESRAGGARRAGRDERRSTSPRRSSRSRTRTWRARSRWSRSSAATIRAASRSSPSAAPGRCTPRRSRARCGIPRVLVPAVPRQRLRARHAARRPPRRQGLDPGVPLERGRRRAGRTAVRADPRARRVAELRQEGFAGEPEIQLLDQHALLRPELRARGRRSPAGAIDDGRARARVPPLRRAARRALRLRDRGRGDRARRASRSRRSGSARRSTSSRANGERPRPSASQRQVYFRGHGLRSTRVVAHRYVARAGRARSTGPA